MFTLDAKSLERLDKVHPDLKKVVLEAAKNSQQKFKVLEGMRTLERQRELFAKGATKTLRSRHLTGHAVDIAPVDDDGDVSWDWPLYYVLEPIIKSAASKVGVPINWGGDWKTFKDGPHWELPWTRYP